MITNFNNCVTFLNHVYDEKNRTTSFFSYEYLTQKLGLKARSHIYRVFKGERKLTPHMGIKLAHILGLSHPETDYFVTMILIEGSESRIEREFLKEKLDILKIELDTQHCPAA